MPWADQLKQNSQELLFFLPRFILRPVEGMKHPPKWDWPVIAVFQGAFTVAAGLLSGLLAQSFWAILANLILFPISTLLIQFLTALAIYFWLERVFHVVASFLSIFLVVMCASVPLVLFRILGPLGIPHDLLGVGAALTLLTVGLVENFRLPRHRVIRWTGGTYAIFFALWMVWTVAKSHSELTFEKKLQPTSIDQLEKKITH